MTGDPQSRAVSIITRGLVAVALALGLAWFTITTPPPPARPLLDQCAGYEEQEHAPVNVAGFQELAAPGCD